VEVWAGGVGRHGLGLDAGGPAPLVALPNELALLEPQEVPLRIQLEAGLIENENVASAAH